MRRLPWLLTGLLGSAACGATQLEARFAPAPAAPSEKQVAQHIARAELRQERPVAVGITAEPTKLCAWDLTAGLLWERQVDAKSAPLVVGDAVVVHEASGIVVRDLASGEPRTTLEPSGGHLVGADAVGDTLVISIGYAQGETRGTVAVVQGKDVRWQKTLPQPVGVPALVENQVLVPWGTQRLSVLTADDGTELARWDFHNLVLGRAQVDRGAVFVGQLGLLHVTPDLPDHRDGPLTLYAPAKRPLPGQPPLLRDGYGPVPGPDNAQHRVRVDWRPAHSDTPGVEDQLLVFSFYRVLFGMSDQRDEVRWVRALDHDVVGAFKQPGGLFVADEGGQLRFLDTQGNTRYLRNLERRLRTLTLRPGSLLMQGDASASALSATALESPSGSLHEQLLSAARFADDRLAPARALAVQNLAKTDAPSVTRELIQLCTPQNHLHDAGQLAACDELAKRETGSQDVLEALRQKASFLDDNTLPPVGALAQAAARMQLKQAGPLLLSHAEDPHTPAAELVQVFLALENLQYRPAVPQLERFVRLHHAEPAGSELTPALQAALLALGALRGTAVRDTVANIASDNFTLPQVKQTAEEVVVALDSPIPLPPPEPKADPKAQPKAAAKETKPTADGKEAIKEGKETIKEGKETLVIEEAVLTDPRPYALDAGSVQKAFRPLHAALERCLADDPSHPKSARISMIISGEGKVDGFLVTPTTMQNCAEPVLRNALFPATRLGRQHLVHTVQAAASVASPAPKKADAKP